MLDDEEAEALRAVDEDPGGGPDVPPLCPRHLARDVFWTSDSRACPLCDRGGRSGSWLICAACAQEAQVCVYDAAPLDGSSQEALPWLAEVVAEARREREAAFQKPRGAGRYSQPQNRR